jgi:hypothetical protein
MKISKIMPKRNGVDGMTVFFEKPEQAQDGLSYNNEHQVSFKMPVSHELRILWTDSLTHFKTILNLNPKLPAEDILLNWVSFNNGGGIMAAVKIKARHGRWYSAVVPVVESADDYKDYDDLYEVLDKLWSATAKYCLGTMVATPRQYMLDLFENSERSGKEFEMTREEIENLDDEETLRIVREKLEARGDVFLIKAGEEA